MSSAINSALGGLSASQEWFNQTAIAVAHASLPDAPASDDLVGAVVQSKLAEQAVKINAAALRNVMDTEQSLIDVLA
jgi:hypothetical protein